MLIGARRNFFAGRSEVHQGRPCKGGAAWGVQGPEPERFSKNCKKAMKILRFKKVFMEISRFFQLFKKLYRIFGENLEKNLELFRNMHL